MQAILSIDDAGTITGIYSDELLDLLAEGDARVERASHVEPAPGGGWTADLGPIGGPVLTGFATHAAAIAAEVEWINANRIEA